MRKYSAFSLIELSIVILIIGILIAGVTQGSRLVAKMRLATAKQLTQSSPVTSIPNILLWLETTSESSLATGTATFTNIVEPDDATQIGRWNDINPQVTSIYRNNFSQATLANQPLYTVNSIGGLPALKFDGANDVLNSTLSAVGSAYTGFMVVYFPVIGNYGIVSSSAASGFSWLLKANGTYGVAVAQVTYLGSLNYGSSTVLNAVTPYIIQFNWSDASDNISFRVNGVAAGTTVPTNSATQTFSGNGLMTIGAEVNALFFNGSVGEIILFERVLKSEEITSTEKYLGKKWGIKTN